jgi:hypothetical protein
MISFFSTVMAEFGGIISVEAERKAENMSQFPHIPS